MIRHGWRCLCCLLLTSWLAGCRSASHDGALRPHAQTAAHHVATVTLQTDELTSPAIASQEADNTQPTRGDAAESVRATSYQDTDLELPQPAQIEDLAVPAAQRDSATLGLPDVIRSVQTAYPLLVSAIQQQTVEGGKLLASQGAFDLQAKVYGIAAPEGYYPNYRNGMSLDQPLFHGGYVYGGYKIGDGSFQPWYKERETNEGGEFSIGVGTPLLKDRVIDKRRAELFQAELGLQAVEPAVRAQLLEFVRTASQVYWKWVAAGQALTAQQELLRNAQQRVTQIEARVEAGDLARITRINNEQLIAARETKLIESQRKLQEAAIKLSLFLRDEQGNPVVVQPRQLPADFPQPFPHSDEALDRDIARALEASPALAELNLVIAQASVELRAAENQLLPKLDARALASKDVGAEASDKGDKTPFELEAGLFGELPLQRREAHGKIRSVQGKLAQLQAKRQFLRDKTVAAVQDAVSALRTAAGQINRATINLRLARNVGAGAHSVRSW